MRLSRARRGWRPASVLVAVTVVASLGGPGLGVAQAAPDQSGPLMNYVVNARPDSVHVAGAEAAVEAAGGTGLQTWPEIGVVIAQTRNSDFRYDVRHNQFAPNVQSVGATRTAPVDEPFNLGSDGPPPTVADPREAPQFNLKQIKADRAHDITKGSRDVLVGVNDGGVDDTRPDLAPNFDQADSVNCTNSGVPDTTFGAWRPKPPDQALQEYHGTHVAGIIAAAENGTGVVGVAPNVRIASVKVADDFGFIYPEYSICGIMWATAHHMDVTNHSYFIDPWQFWCNDGADQGAVREAVRRAFKYSNDQGTLSVAAAGNSNYDLAHKTTDNTSPDDNANPVNRTIDNGCLDMPTELPGVVTVASTTSAKAKSSFSNFGQNVIDVAAPGSSVLSTFPGGKWFPISGTSMASPHVSGVAALLKSVHPDWGPSELTHALRADADDNPCPADVRCTGTTANNAFFGEGMVDALQAVGDFKLPAGDLASTIALSNCSASVVRYPNSLDTDPAIMLTNGHCYQLLGAGKAVADLPSTRSGTLLNAAGTNIGTVRADRLLYSTMTDTDITLYRLNESYAALKTRTGATPLTIRSSPARGDEQMYVPSGYWNKVWDCHLSGFVYQVREYVWTWKDSLRYAKPCSTIPGTSGSPVVDAKRRDIIGINNTGNEDGQQCTFDNPCEVAQDGTITVDQGRSYGQQTWWINTCVDPGTRAFDLTEPGCRLPQPS